MTVYFFIGKEVINSMTDKIVLLAFDEVHACLPSQWGNEQMREEMYTAPSYLKAQVSATTRAPVLAMSASVKVKTNKRKGKSEIEEIKTLCSIAHSPTTVITISPILSNHIYVSVKKPPTKNGFFGKDCFSFKPDKVGTVHVLWQLYLKRFVEDILTGKTPKRAVLFVKKMTDLMEVDDFLTSKLGHLDISRDPNTCPWVTNSSATGKITAEKIRARSTTANSSIHLYITTSVMLFGLDLKDVSIVILMSPFNSLNSFLQAGGRAGRRQGDGYRKKAVVYTLYNGTDIRRNSPMEESVRNFHDERSCLKQKVAMLFSPKQQKNEINNTDWCCSFCSLK